MTALRGRVALARWTPRAIRVGRAIALLAGGSAFGIPCNQGPPVCYCVEPDAPTQWQAAAWAGTTRGMCTAPAIDAGCVNGFNTGIGGPLAPPDLPA